METWNNNNLPENHQFFASVEFVAVTEGTWNRKKNDGSQEVAPKWSYITAETENVPSFQVDVYSSTDKEELKLHKSYDIIAKRAVGKDGTFYGWSLKGYGEAGKPIPKKEPQSRFQKGQALNAKAEALKVAASLFKQSESPDPDAVIMVAEVFEGFIKGEYKTAAKGAKEAFADK